MAQLEIKPSVAARARVALVVAVAAAITGALVFLLAGGSRDSLSRKVTITTYMPDVTGLVRNSEVRRNGIRIGQVTNVDISPSLDPQRAVRVDMKVVARFLRTIPRDSQTSIGADTLVGYKFVDIAAGNSPLMLADNGVLPSEPLKRAVDRADSIRRFKEELSQANDLLVQLSSAETKIGHFVMGDQEYRDILKQVSDFDRTLHAFLGPSSVLGGALFTNDLYRQVTEPLRRVEKNLASMQRGEGAAGRLFASDEQYNRIVQDLRGFRANLADANAGKGPLSALLRDENGYEKVRAMLTATDSMLRSLQAGEGNLGHLLREPQLYESLQGSLQSLRALLKDLRTDPRKYLRYKVF